MKRARGLQTCGVHAIHAQVDDADGRRCNCNDLLSFTGAGAPGADYIRWASAGSAPKFNDFTCGTVDVPDLSTSPEALIVLEALRCIAAKLHDTKRGQLR